MFFKYRPAQVRDLPECRHCLRDHFAYDADALEDLTALWRGLLREGAAVPMVIEDISEPPGERIVWFCMKVFVGDDYARHLKSGAPPLMGRHILDLWRAGRSPLMDLDCIRRANSPGGGGLNLLVLNSGSPPSITESDKWPVVASKVIEFTPLCAGGYRLNEMLIEVYDDFTASWLVGTGMRLRADYADFYGGGDGGTPTHPRARLYGVTAAEATEGVGSAVAPIFQREEPCFFFSPSEQELLQWALSGDVDEDLAECLSVSPVTLKKRWGSIYDRVLRVSPALLCDAHAPEKRGTEKKRRLLGYLRHHLEELRPVCRPL